MYNPNLEHAMVKMILLIELIIKNNNLSKKCYN